MDHPLDSSVLTMNNHRRPSSFPQPQETLSEDISVNLEMRQIEAAATVLTRLWQELELEGEPILFRGSRYSHFHLHHVMSLLNKAVERGKNRKRPKFGQIDSWERLQTPSYAHGIAAIPLAGPLLQANMIHEASLADRHTVLGPVMGWFRYDFTSGWSALSVMLAPDDDGDAVAITAVANGHQDEWLAFLAVLSDLHGGVTRMRRKGRIEVLGEGDSAAEERIKATTFDDVILEQHILDAVAAQRCIFDPTMLEKYARRRLPRKRIALLFGPPGTGKTTLLKAEAARHVAQGGLVFYIFASQQSGRSWRHLYYALSAAAESKLPTLILVEDFELFLADTEHPQRVLNILDGVETPDNEAGTLLLLTSNDTDKIDPRLKDRPGRIDSLIEIGAITSEALAIRFLQRFLDTDYREEVHAPLAKEFIGQTGSHIREVALQGTIHAIRQNRDEVWVEDLLWAHKAILKGRESAADPKKTAAPSTKKQKGMGFSTEKS